MIKFKVSQNIVITLVTSLSSTTLVISPDWPLANAMEV